MRSLLAPHPIYNNRQALQAFMFCVYNAVVIFIAVSFALTSIGVPYEYKVTSNMCHDLDHESVTVTAYEVFDGSETALSLVRSNKLCSAGPPTWDNTETLYVMKYRVAMGPLTGWYVVGIEIFVLMVFLIGFTVLITSAIFAKYCVSVLKYAASDPDSYHCSNRTEFETYVSQHLRDATLRKAVSVPS